MKAVGVIPARWQSTRFPGKSLAMLDGRPMILRVLERASSAATLNSVLVATDDNRIKETVEKNGGKAVMTNSTHESGTDRIAEAISGVDCAVVVNIQGDEPFIDPLLIDRLVDEMISGHNWDMATAAAPIKQHEQVCDKNICKVVFDIEGRAMYFSRSVIPFVRDPDFACDTPVHWRHIGIYAYTRAFLEKFVAAAPSLIEKAERLEQLRALHLGARIKVLETEDNGIGVDTPEDLAIAEKRISDLLLGNSYKKQEV